MKRDAAMLCTVPDLLIRQAGSAPDQPAIVDGTTMVTYADLADLARRAATLVSRHTTSPGERVAILLARSPEAIAAFFGAHLAGAVPVFVNEQLRPRQVAGIIGHAGARLVLTRARHRDLLRDTTGTPIVDVDSIREAPTSAGVPLIGRDLSTLLFTSGSTGTPKGVMVTHDNLLAGALIVADYLLLTPRDRTIAVLPWSFDYGLNQVLATFAAGGTVVIQRSTFPPDICRTLATANVTGMAAVPPLWVSMTGYGSPFLQLPLPALRYITNSGGQLLPTTVSKLRHAHPHVRVYLMYGLTEAFRSTYLDPAQVDNRPRSIGKAIPNTQILVLDDNARPCPPGQVGQLVHRGPTVAAGYWNEPAATATVFRPHPLAPHTGTRETVVYSGDYVTTDPDGYLYYVGRRDEMFKSRGIRTSPTEIEAELCASGLLTEASVIAVDTDNGEPELVAAVVPADPNLDLAELSAYCRAELPAHMQPHRIVPAAALPRTHHGKINRAAVRDHLAERATSGRQQ